MQVIILAAGLGRRLGELTKDNTKCMVKVNGVALIDRLLGQLSDFSFRRIVIVIGYKGKNLQEYLGDQYQGIPLEYVSNPIYDKTNNIYSLALAKEKLAEDDTLLLESDMIFDKEIFQQILSSPEPNVAVVDKYESWMDGTMVTMDQDNNIASFVPKSAFNYSCIGSYYKTVNIYKFSREFACHKYIPFLEAYSKALGNNEYYEQVLRVLAMLDKTGLKGLPLNNLKWYEIDDVQDLDIAETLFAEKDMHLSKYQQRYGGYWRFPHLLDFCYLVNPYFPSEQMKNELRASFDILLTEYPSGMQVNTLLAAKYFNIRQQYVCVGNGAAELIKSLVERLGEGRLGVVFPTFEEYPNRREGKHLVVYTPCNANFSYTVNDLEQYFSDKELHSLLLINPDNPSGNFIAKSDVLELVTWAQKRDIRLIIDESFVDFSQDGELNSLLDSQILESYPNLVVIKSISKSYGVPGLRLGILATGNEELIMQVRKDVPIWNINSFAEYYMQIFGKYEKDYQKACRTFIAERDRFYKDLQQVPYLRVVPSQANYFLCEVIGRYTSQELTKLLLEKYNILIKDCSGKAGFESKNYVRIAVRNFDENTFLTNVLNNAI